jgi:PAS domain S-box-containing protein
MESELGRVFDALPGLVWTASADGQIDLLNQRWSDYTGLGADACRGRGWQAAVHPEDLPGLLAAWRPGSAPAAPVETEVRLRGRGGDYRWFLFRAHPSLDASGQIKWSGLGTDINERVQAEEALRASERRFGLIVDGLPVLLSTATPDGELDQANRHYLEYFGASLEELKARETVHGLHPDDRSRVLAARQAAIEAGRPYEIECRRRRADGVYRWFYLRAFPLHDAQGRVALWYRLQIDIEDQKRAEALLAGEKRLLEMVASGRPMAEILEALCRFVESMVSGCFCSIVLLDPDGTKLQEAIAPSLAAEFNDAVRGWPLTRIGGPCVTAARDNVQVIMSDVASDSRWRNGWRALARKHDLRSCWSTPIVSQAGKVLGTFALYWSEAGSPNPLQLELIEQFTNIASIAMERAQRDAALRRSEARLAEAERELQLTIDTLPILVATYRPDGSRIFVNRTWRDYTGLPFDAAIDAERTTIVHTEDGPRIAREWEKSLAAGTPFEAEMRLRRADGEYRWHSVRRAPARDDSGAIVGWYSVGADIEEQKRAEDALRQSEARLSEAERELRLTLDTIPVMVWRGAANGYVQQLNKRWFEYTGTTPEQVRGRRWKQCVHPDDLERHVQIGTDYVAAGTPIDSEARLRRFDGEYRRFLFRPAALRDQTGKITGWYGTIIDIEDRKRAEEKAVEAERELQRTIDNIPVLVGTYSADGRRLSANKRALEVTGLSAEDLPDERWRKAFHPDEAHSIESQWRACVASGEPFEREVRTRMADGSYRWHLTRRVPFRDEAGKVIRWYGISYDIDDQKRAEEELRRSEAFLAKAQRLSLTGSFSFYSATGEFIWSEELYRIFEFERGVPINLELVASRYHPEDRHVMEEVTEGIRIGAPEFDYEHRLLMPDGSIKHIRVVAQGTPNKSGNGLEYFGAVQDITDRKRAELALARSERNLKLFVATVPAHVWSARLDGSAEFFNQQYLDYVGLPAEQVLDRGWTATVHPDDLDGLEATWQAILASGNPGEAEARLRRQDGQYRWFLFRATPLRDDNGNIVRWYGFNTDIEDRKRAEEELRRSEAHLAKAQQLSLTGSFSFNPATDEATWSEEVYRIYGYQPGTRATLAMVRARYHPDDMHLFEQQVTRIRNGATDLDYEHRLLMPDGSIKHLHMVAQGNPSAGGSIEYIGAVQDVTQRKRAEEQLRRSQAYLAEAQRLSHTGSWVVDYANRKPIHSSEEHHRLFGFDPANGMPPWRAWMDRIHPEDRPRTKELIERSSREKTDLEMDYRICLPDGTVKYVHDVGHPILNAAGDVVEFIGTSVDVTQRRLAEDALDKARSELAHVTRAMSLGALTASIAHEVNQPLAGIITNASTCLRMLAADPPNIAGARMTAQRTIRDGNRAADVITRLRALFSKKAAATETVDLNEATREVLALVFSDLLRNRVFLRTELDDDHPPLVTGDRVQLQQVILNLVRNASDAMRDVNDRPRHLLVRVEREAEGGARLLVRDAGVGIEPENIERLFDAFYTTKNDGMGIGLSVSRSIIESHGGRLWAEANDGPGTSFLFSVPAPVNAATDDRIGGSVWTSQLNNGRDAMRKP